MSGSLSGHILYKSWWNLKTFVRSGKNKFSILVYFLCEIMLNRLFKSIVHNLLGALVNEGNMIYPTLIHNQKKGLKKAELIDLQATASRPIYTVAFEK